MQKYLHLEWGIEPQSPTWKVRALSIQPLDLGRGVDFNGVLNDILDRPINYVQESGIRMEHMGQPYLYYILKFYVRTYVTYNHTVCKVLLGISS